MISSVDEFYQQLKLVYKKGNTDEVETYLKDCLKNVTPCCGTSNDLYLAAVNEAGTFYQNTGRYETALGLWEKAAYLIMDAHGGDSLEYAANRNHIADTCRVMGESGKAFEAFQEALKLYERNVGTENYFYASTLNNIALTYQGIQDMDHAVEYAEAAMKILQKLEGFEHELGTACVNLSTLYRQKGRNERSKELLEQALEIFEKSEESGRSYAAALSGEAAIFYEQGDYRQAERLYRLALEHTAAFAGSTADSGVLYVNLACASEKLGKREDAIRYLKRAQKIYQKIYGEGHGATVRVGKLLRHFKTGAQHAAKG